MQNLRRREGGREEGRERKEKTKKENNVSCVWCSGSRKGENNVQRDRRIHGVHWQCTNACSHSLKSATMPYYSLGKQRIYATLAFFVAVNRDQKIECIV